MRIFRLVVALLIALAVMLPFVTLASESPNTDINTNINLNTVSDFFLTNTAKADQTIVEGIEATEPKKTEIEIKNELILENWKKKQSEKWNSLPKGQFTINASAYTASADECNNNLGITSSGIKVHDGTIACPPEFPFGAKMKIEGYGTYICEDRGGAIKGNHVDIYMENKSEAFAFGRKNLLAEIVL
jgi:3D (Asp-Asp-Asp) domain-containing protein